MTGRWTGRDRPAGGASPVSPWCCLVALRHPPGDALSWLASPCDLQALAPGGRSAHTRWGWGGGGGHEWMSSLQRQRAGLLLSPVAPLQAMAVLGVRRTPASRAVSSTLTSHILLSLSLHVETLWTQVTEGSGETALGSNLAPQLSCWMHSARDLASVSFSAKWGNSPCLAVFAREFNRLIQLGGAQTYKHSVYGRDTEAPRGE